MLSDVRLRERAKVSIEYWSENFLIDLSRQISSKNGYSEQQIWTQLLFLFRSGRALGKKRWTLFAIEASDKINSTPLPAQPHFQFLQAPLEGQWTLEQINGARAKQFLRFWNSQLLTSDGLDKNWTYDSFYGLVGLGSYALNHRSTQNGRRLIQNVARQLRQTAQPHRYGSYWPVSPKVFQHAPRSMSHNDNVALGMAHGISGVVSFLCLAAKAKIDRHQNLDLAQRAVGFMLNLESEMKFEAFPEYVDFKKSRFVHKGAVWCGGDMAVGNALSLLAEELDDQNLRQNAERVFLRGCRLMRQRRDQLDHSLCHGTAGATLMTYRMWQRTGQQIYRDLSSLFYKDLSEQLSPKKRSRLRQSPSSHQLIEGIGGSLLMLLAPFETGEFAWDAPFLLKLPYKPRGL